MSELENAARVVAAAWNHPGRAPNLHQREQERLMAHWAPLARAVQRLAQLVEEGEIRPATERMSRERLADQIRQAALIKVPPAVRLDRPQETP